jgi:hypothetical protein
LYAIVSYFLVKVVCNLENAYWHDAFCRQKCTMHLCDGIYIIPSQIVIQIEFFHRYLKNLNCVINILNFIFGSNKKFRQLLISQIFFVTTFDLFFRKLDILLKDRLIRGNQYYSPLVRSPFKIRVFLIMTGLAHRNWHQRKLNHTSLNQYMNF